LSGDGEGLSDRQEFRRINEEIRRRRALGFDYSAFDRPSLIMNLRGILPGSLVFV
jgi:hypothetical protein